MLVELGKRGRCWSIVSRILYRLIAALAQLAVRSGRSRDLETVVLRHQLSVLRRQIDRPSLNDGDRTLLGAIAAALPQPNRLVGSSASATGATAPSNSDHPWLRRRRRIWTSATFRS